MAMARIAKALSCLAKTALAYLAAAVGVEDQPQRRLAAEPGHAVSTQARTSVCGAIAIGSELRC
jgi:hypothetical protein